MAWRAAKSLIKLRDQIDAEAPQRSKISDGLVGDALHASRSSDHNPWIVDGNARVVSALDITHDPRAGVDCNAIAKALALTKDARVKYVIWNREIWNPAKAKGWRPYTGTNPHDKHIHISVMSTKALYDDPKPWVWGGAHPLSSSPPAVAPLPILFEGISGHEAHVARVKAALLASLQQEVGFGPLLGGLVKGFQKQNGLVQDGKIGAYSWEKL